MLDTHKTLGKLSANAPIPTPKLPKPKHGSFLGNLVVAIVATVATVLTAGALAIGMGATGSLFSAGLSALGGSIAGTAGVGAAVGVGLAAGFIGSIAGQTAANLLGMQRGIDFGGALLSGLATAATAGIGYGLKHIGTLHNLSTTIGNNYDAHYFSASSAFELMEQNAASQAFNTTLRRHQHFDWTELGVATLTGGFMGSEAGKEFGNKLEALDNHTGMLRAELQTLAGAGAESLTCGTHFDAVQVLGDNLGSAIGNAVVSRMASAPHYLDEYQATLNELSLDGVVSDYQHALHAFNDLQEQQLLDEERSAPAPSSDGYTGGYCAIPAAESNFSPIPEGFYEHAALSSLGDAAARLWDNYGDDILRYGPKALGIWGSSTPASENTNSLAPSDYLKMAGSMALDFVPVVGQVKAASEVWSGKDLLTGTPINRALAALGLVPGGKLAYTALKGLGKAGAKAELLASKTAVVEELVQTVPNKTAQRMHIEANIAQTRAGIESSVNFIEFDRRAIARGFYAKGGWTSEKINSHLNGIDFSKEVSVELIPKGTMLQQHQMPKDPIGNYFTVFGADRAKLGIYTSGRTTRSYVATSDISVLRSTTGDITDSWSMLKYKWEIRLRGGETQYFTHNAFDWRLMP